MHRFDRRSGSEDHGTEAPLAVREWGGLGGTQGLVQENVDTAAMPAWCDADTRVERVTPKWSALVGLSCGPAVVSQSVRRPVKVLRKASQ